MEDWIHADMQHHEPGWGRAYPLWCSLLAKFGMQTGAEIGVAFGGHSEAILSNTAVRKLYSVDMFRHDPVYEDPLNYPQERFDELFPFVQARLSRFGDRCELVRLESAAAAAWVPDGLDFVYLDANHSFEGVFRDLRLWAVKVRTGGIIGGHDYGHPDFPGVRTAVDRFFRRFGWLVHEEGEGVWWTTKLPLRTSFVVPAFNCAETINETLDSILRDNFHEHDELIIVDDASSDTTPRILDDTRALHPSITVLTHPVNKGTAAAARNTGIEAASNPLVFCLDSDNVLASGTVGPLVDHLFKTGADAAAFGEIRFFRTTTQDVSHRYVFNETVTLADALAGHHWPGPSGNYLFTRESWLRAGRYHEPSLENPSLDSWIFGVRQLGTGSRMVSLPGTWYFHRYGHDSHYARNWRRGSQSLAGLIGLIPLLDLLEESEVEYILGIHGRYSWYENLRARPLKLKGLDLGQDGIARIPATHSLGESCQRMVARWKKLRSIIKGAQS